MLTWTDFRHLRNSNLWLPPFLLAIILILIAQIDYLTFHTIAELSAIFVAIAVCAIAWETRWLRRNRFLSVLAAGYFWVAFIDLNHAFTFEGMDLYVEGTLNVSAQFWLVARFLEMSILIASPHLINRDIKIPKLFTIYGLFALIGCGTVLMGEFPTAFSPVQGLTAFKVYSEYFIIAGLLIASAQLHLIQFSMPKEEEVLLGAAIIMTIAAELAFTLYKGSTDPANLLGHIFKIFSFWFIFRAIVVSNLREPYTRLDAQLKKAQSLFEHAGISLWHEDLSAIQEELSYLRQNGVSDLRTYLQKNPDKVTDFVRKVKVVDVNRATLQLFESEDEESFTSRVDLSVGAGAQGVFIDELCAIWNGEGYFKAQAQFVTTKGKNLTCLISFRIPTDVDDFKAVPVSVVDLTEKLELKQQVASFFDTPMHMNLIASTTDGRIIKVNPAVKRILGYTPTELEGRSFLEFVHPDDIEKTRDEMASINLRGKTFHFENRYRRKTGEYRLIAWSSVATDGIAYAIATDITNRKHAEEINARLSSIRDTILRCQSLMVKRQSAQDMLLGVAKELVQAQGFNLVWFAEYENSPTGPTASVTAFAHVDKREPTEPLVQLVTAENSPAVMTLRTGNPIFANSHMHDKRFGKWLSEAKKYGLDKTASVPILDNGTPIASLNIHASRDTFPSEQEIALMNELAANIALSLATKRMTEEVVSAHDALAKAALGAINALAATLEKRDPYTSGHQNRVAQLSAAIARKLGWSEFRIEGLRLGATVHDIGKIYVPAEILNRPGKLTEAEFEIIKSHPTVGQEILKDVVFPWPIKDMVLQHHERIDGSGYPGGLKGNEIIPEAQIIAVADVVEAITAHRPYRPALGIEKGLDELQRGRGTAYATDVVDACMKVIKEDHFHWT